MKNRILKILKRVFITILILTILVFITNEIIYRKSIPNDLSESNWNGNWKSSKYKFVSGKILTSIPENLENQKTEFKSKTVIYYNLWSFYKPGQVKIVD